MSDYTREQQLDDIRDAFDDERASITFLDEVEAILVHSRGMTYQFDIGSDDDFMTFTNIDDDTDTVIVEFSS